MINPGEGYVDGETIRFDDPSTLAGKNKKSNKLLRNNTATLTLTPAMIGTRYIGGLSVGGKAGFNMEEFKVYPAVGFGFTSKVNASDLLSDVGINNKDADIFVTFEPKLAAGAGNDVFKVSVTQTFHTGQGVNDKTTQTLLQDIDCETWATTVTLGGTAPGPLTNWTSFSQGQTIRIIMDVRDVYNFEVKIEHDNGAGVFVETQRLAGTGYEITQGIVTNEVLQTTRDMSLPLAPCLCLPPFGFVANSISHKYDGRFAPITVTPVQIAAGVTATSYTGYTSIGPITGVLDNITSTVVDGNDPRVVMKTKPLNLTQISTTPGPTGQVFAVDFVPEDTAQFGFIGELESVYYIPQGTTGAARAFTGTAPPHIMDFNGGYAIECPDLPVSGFVGKAYDLTGTKRGIGQKSAIIHIVPAENTITSLGANIVICDYVAKFPMPVHICFDNPIDFQSLRFRLRNIETGKLLQDLRHPSQIIVRIIPKDPKNFQPETFRTPMLPGPNMQGGNMGSAQEYSTMKY